MSESLLMQKGLKGLFNPEKKFEAEASYGKKILYVAWSVEILAAIIGLTIAWATAYDAYSRETNPDQGTLINAIIGALPFLVIAVIEPTKIPLAGGFYKTRILGWKLLILTALMALTLVTFETMFNGLERQLTNVTKEVVEADNNINSLNDDIEGLEEELRKVVGADLEEETGTLKTRLDDLKTEKITAINQKNEDFQNRIDQLNSDKNRKLNELSNFSGGTTSDAQLQIDLLEADIERLNNEKNTLIDQKDNALEDYKSSIISGNQDEANIQNNKIQNLKSQKGELISDRERIEKQIDDLLIQENESIENQQIIYKDILNEIEQQQGERIEKKGIFENRDTIIRNEFDPRREEAKANNEREINRLKTQANNERASLKQRISEINNKIDQIDSNIDEILEISPNKSEIDPKKIDDISRNYDSKIDQITESIRLKSDEISRVSSNLRGTQEENRQAIQGQIKVIDDQIAELYRQRDEEVTQTEALYDQQILALQEQLDSRSTQVIDRKQTKETIEKEIEKLIIEVNAAKKVKRDAAQESQVYRLASLFYGKHDVADVTKDEIKVVSIVWFGSIALIVSTVGTILALISYILRDPEAFVERQKTNFLRYFMKVIRIFFLRLGRLLASLTNLVFALIKLVLSFAEIFKGLVGKPMQRSFRKAMASIRRRMNKPKIVEIEKIVEKEVQVEVEKIVEVEKVVEKIVEKEVPVHKVEIKEVPVEVIRKELVYVPLYSTDTGLIDASTELKGAKPKLDDKK